MKHNSICTWSLFLLQLLPSSSSASLSYDLTKIKVRSGYKTELFVDNVKNARSMTLGSQGTLFVGTRSEGKVYAVLNKQGKNQLVTLATDLNMPNGVAFAHGNLYVAELSRIIQFEKIEERLKKGEKTPFTVVYNQLPTEEHHGAKYLAFGPDKSLYFSLGVPCNICKESDPRFGTILRMKVPQKNSKVEQPEIFAKGIRNSMGFAWHPTTQELWFTDNGRDMMGDDLPPDELNIAPKKGLHFGFPYCHGGTIPDPQYGKERNCTEFEKPVLNLGSHVAALGVKFWNNQVVIAEHGSWNRSTPIGYRLMTADITKNSAKNYSVLAEGWLSEGDKTLGRPVDILVLDSKAILVSDDQADAIYKISKN